ncbi:MAG: DUF2780 domain-containing protein [Steroidobacteraceae bacterium]
MEQLIQTLMNQLGINETQARGGAAALFNVAQERLGEAQFKQLLGGLPGMDELLKHVPSAVSSGSGFLTGLAGMTDKLAGSDLKHGAQLLTAFSSLGLNRDMLTNFVFVVQQYLHAHGGDDLVNKVRSALKL